MGKVGLPIPGGCPEVSLGPLEDLLGTLGIEGLVRVPERWRGQHQEVRHQRQGDHGKSIEELESILTEPINGRIIDAINYMLLLNSMINSKRKSDVEDENTE